MSDRTLLSALGALILLAGCGGGGGRADAAPEGGGPPDTAGSDAGDAGASCTTLLPGAAPAVGTTLTPISALTDVPSGGTITSGTYFRTSTTIYFAPTCTVLPGVPMAAAFRFMATSASSGVADMVVAVAVPGEQHLATWSSSYTTAGTTMTRTMLCYTLDGVDSTTVDGGVPGGQVRSSSYTATPTEIRLYTPIDSPGDAGSGGCGTEVVVLQKQ